MCYSMKQVTYKCGHKRAVMVKVAEPGDFGCFTTTIDPGKVDCPLCQDKKHPTIVSTSV